MNAFTELLRRVEITCKARYCAAARLHRQHRFSQWTLSALAIGQVVITLIPALHLRQNFTPDYVVFGSIFFAVLILAYSLLLGMGDYSARSVKLHECGMELGRLARELYPLTHPEGEYEERYASLSTKYYDILAKYENHTRGDYNLARYEYYTGIPLAAVEAESEWRRFYRNLCRWLDLKKSLLGAYVWLSASYAHYVVSMLLIWGWICALVWR